MQAGVVAPLVRIADADFEGRELRFGLHLRRRGHPLQAIDASAEGGKEVAHHELRPLFFGTREVLLHIHLADRLPERVARRIDGPLPSLAQLRRARQHAAVERELLIDKSLRQKRRRMLDRMKCQVVLPGIERLAPHERGDAADGAGLPQHEPGLLLQSGRFQKTRPVQTRRALVESRARPVIVGLTDLLRVLPLPMDCRDAVLELVDTSGLGVGVRSLCQTQNVRDVGAVFLTVRRHVC